VRCSFVRKQEPQRDISGDYEPHESWSLTALRSIPSFQDSEL